jgi:hypothetical protein
VIRILFSYMSISSLSANSLLGIFSNSQATIDG